MMPQKLRRQRREQRELRTHQNAYRNVRQSKWIDLYVFSRSLGMDEDQAKRYSDERIPEEMQRVISG